MNQAKWWTNRKCLQMVGLTAMLMLSLGSCQFEDGDPISELWPLVVTANTDYLEADCARLKVDEESGFPVIENSTALNSDLGGLELSDKSGRSLAYLVGRGGSIIYKIDPDQGMKVLDSFTVGAGGWVGENPQDVLIVSKSKAYVTRFGSDDILIVDPRDGTRLGNIVFTGLPTNADNLARPADMVMAKGKVFVALQNLNAGFNYCEATIENGIIAVIDPKTDAIETHVTLHRADPYRIVYSKKINRILIAAAGNFATDSPGCATWNPDPDVSRSGLELMIPRAPYTVTLAVSGDDPLINGNIYDVALAGDDTAYILVAEGFRNVDRALRVSLATGAVDPEFRLPAAATGYDDLSGIGTVQGLVFIGDRALSGVYVHDAVADEAAGFVDLTLPPMSMAILER